MAPQGSNPIESYEAAVKLMLTTLAGVKADQMSSSTPCSEWNVQSLINHNLRVAEFCNNGLSGKPADPDHMFSVSHPLPTEGAEAVFSANTNAVLATAKSMNMQTVVETPFGTMPAGDFLMIFLVDVVVHKWDLAKATNQNTTMDSGLTEACYQSMLPGIEMGREGGFFGAEIQAPISASIQDKLLSLSGRQP